MYILYIPHSEYNFEHLLCHLLIFILYIIICQVGAPFTSFRSGQNPENIHIPPTEEMANMVGLWTS